MKIGITGSIVSGKSTAAKILTKRKYPLFSADQEVSELYKKRLFKNVIIKKLKLKKNLNIKIQIKDMISQKKIKLNQLEKIIHPYVRKSMTYFLKINRNKKFLFLEIPLLIESRLLRFFDIVFFVGAKKKIRLKRFIEKNGSKEMFLILDKHQQKEVDKKKSCDHVVNNNTSIQALNKKITTIFKKYE